MSWTITKITSGFAVLVCAVACSTAPDDWTSNGRSYSLDLAFSDEVAALAGQQGSPEEYAATQTFLEYVMKDNQLNVEESDILNELASLEEDNNLLYLHGSKPYADLQAPSPEALELIEAALKQTKMNARQD